MATEKELIKLAKKLYGDEISIKNYQRVNIYLKDQDIIKKVIKKFRFEDVGNIYDYPEFISPPEDVNASILVANYKCFQRIAISKKNHSILFYSIDSYGVYGICMVSTKKIEKFSKMYKKIISEDSGNNLFKNTDFSCKANEYIEISEDDNGNNKMPTIDATKKKVKDEHLVFDKKSAIYEVMNDITSFFTKESRKLYDKLDIPYKRGIIIHGEPGNGKSAMIREIIRTGPDVAKVIINGNGQHFIKILKSLIKGLNGQNSIVIIEDIDSYMTDENRSEFLNILDGVDIRSGVYFIGTTNYPDKIDPAFMNRSGRFDKAFPIGAPSERMRRLYFTNKNLGKIFSEHRIYKKDYDIEDRDRFIVHLFTRHSKGLPMASLKELITSTAYMLASDKKLTIRDALVTSYTAMTKSRKEHEESFNNNISQMEFGSAKARHKKTKFIEEMY